MNKAIFWILILLLSCSSPVTEPQNLVPKETMSQIVAELALTDQMAMLNHQGNMETQTIFIFKKYGITSKQFSDSYKFYLAAPGSLEDIYSDAQDIIKKKDPEAAGYIEKKLKETKGNPALMR